MYDRKLALELLFDEFITLSHSPIMMEEALEGGGYPLSGLVDSITNPFRVSLVDKITSDYTNNGHEFRLNDAGFKLFWRVDREFDLLKINLGGDQLTNYPHLVAAIKNSIAWSKIR